MKPVLTCILVLALAPAPFLDAERSRARMRADIEFLSSGTLEGRASLSRGADTGLTLSTKFDRDSSMRALFRCDHLPFLQKGIPAVWLFGGFHPGYHEPVDTVDRLEFEKMERAVRLTAAAVRALGSSSAVPRFAVGRVVRSKDGDQRLEVVLSLH